MKLLEKCNLSRISLFLLGITVVFNSVSIIGIHKELKEIKKEVSILEAQPRIEYKNIPNKYMGEHVLTFYTHTGNRTASGTYPKAGRTVAVDKKFIPHGSILYIEGLGFRIAEDTGGNIKGRRLDVFVDSKQEAIQKGTQTAKVYVLK